VDNFEDTDIIPQDIVTFKIKISRKNVGKLTLGLAHSKYFPGIFNECLYFTVLTGERVAAQERVKIDKKVTEYTFPIKIIYTGKNPIKFIITPSCTYGLNEYLDGTIECVAQSEKRKKLLESIKKRKVKIPLSYFQEALKEVGIKINEDSDDSEEEEDNIDNNKNEDGNKNEDNNIQNINKAGEQGNGNI